MSDKPDLRDDAFLWRILVDTRKAKDIAEEYGVSPRTVESWRQRAAAAWHLPRRPGMRPGRFPCTCRCGHSHSRTLAVADMPGGFI